MRRPLSLLLPLLVLHQNVPYSHARPCVISAEDGGQCDPTRYVNDNPEQCYCTNKKPTWNSGTWCTQLDGTCVEKACGSTKCECTCGSGSMPWCGSKFNGAGACFKGIAECPPCEAGFERLHCGCTGVGGINCLEGACNVCVAGKYHLGGLGPCSSCSVCPGPNWVLTSECYARGDAVYSRCPDGWRCDGLCPTQAQIQKCPVDWYCVDNFVKECRGEVAEQCPAMGMTAPEKWCLKGTHLSGGGCQACIPGKYKSAEGTASLNVLCSACAAGSYATQDGADRCTLCVSGKYLSATGTPAGGCDTCAAGTYQSAVGGSACMTCPAGTMGHNAGRNEACAPCSPGQYQDLTGKTSCAACAAGTYSAGIGRTVCSSCPALHSTTIVNGVGAVGPEDCYSCWAGHFFDATTRGCLACPTYPPQYCPGDGMAYLRRVPQPGSTYAVNHATVAPSEDYRVLPCGVCLPPPLEYASEGCTIETNTVCRACSTPRPLVQHVTVPCTTTTDTFFGDCRVALGHMDAGGVCNPCPPGTTKQTTAGQGQRCVLCPVNTYKAQSGDSACQPCADGTLSAGGASRCTRLCPAGSFAFDGDTCMSGGAAVAVPKRTVAAGSADYIRSLALGAALPGGMLLAIQNLGSGSGLIWRMRMAESSPSTPTLRLSDTWKMAGDSTVNGGAFPADGISSAARFGHITGVAMASAYDGTTPPASAVVLLLLTEASLGRVRALRYERQSGLLGAYTLQPRYVAAYSASQALSPGHAPTVLQTPTPTRLQWPMGVAALRAPPPSAPPFGVASGASSISALWFLVADSSAHCVWRMALHNSSHPSPQRWGLDAMVWRGAQRATELFTIPGGATLGWAAAYGSEFRLASPSHVAVLEDRAALNQWLLLGAPTPGEEEGLAAMGFVMDARGVWAFDALERVPTQSLADLMYVCGGGTVNAAALLLGGEAGRGGQQQQQVPCTQLGFRESFINGLSVGMTGGGAALFLSFAAPSQASGGSGVLAVGLGRSPSMMAARLLGRAAQGMALTGGMWWSAENDQRFFVAEGGAVGQAVEYAVGVLTETFVGKGVMVQAGGHEPPLLHCMCSAGLYCEAERQQCVPAPVGSFAPLWTTRPFLCPAGMVSGGPEGKSSAWCGECAYPESFTTFAAGAAVCTRRCGTTQIYSSRNESCIAQCEWAKGEYEKMVAMQWTSFSSQQQQAAAVAAAGGVEGCALCPLGSGATGGSERGQLQGCALCLPSEYGVSEGLCASCPAASSTFYRGATRCTPFPPVTTPCAEDGYAAASASSACSRLPLALQWGAQTNQARKAVGSLVATSDGVVFGGTMAEEEGARPWRVDPADGVRMERVAFALQPPTDDDEDAVHPPPRFELVEVMDGGRILFAAEKGGTCVWMVNQSSTTTQAQSTVWAGVCGTAGDMNGAAATGLARLGHIHALALVHVEDYTPVLLVSTQLDNGCASIRSVSLFDASVSTLVGSDMQRLPSVLIPQCAVAPYMLAVARGTDEVLYGSVGGFKVWRLYALRPTPPSSVHHLSVLTPYITLPLTSRILAMCSRGVLEEGSTVKGMLAMVTADGQLRVRTRTPPMLNMTLYPNTSNWEASPGGVGLQSASLACAGRRVWWSDGGTSVRTVGVSGLMHTNDPNGVWGCIGGFTEALTPTPRRIVCAQVGVGQYTTVRLRATPSSPSENLSPGLLLTAVETVEKCKAGTFGRRAGAASHVECLPCPAGFIAPPGSAGCDPCPGERPFAMGAQCVSACPGGHYQSTTTGAMCRPCQAGTTAPVGARSASECRACRAGEFADATTNGQCAVCPSGTTSLAGSFRCVRVCTVGMCAADGENCLPVVNNWEIVTPIRVPTRGTSMRAVAVGSGGHVFYTDGETVMYVFDDCPAHVVTLAETVVQPCVLEGVDLLAGSSIIGDTLVRGFSSMALAHGFVDPAGRTTRLLYVASYRTHSVYRFPLLFMSGGYGTVDAEGTTALLGGVRAQMGSAAAQAVYDRYYAPAGSEGYEYPDGSGCDGWRLIGRAGAPGSGQGPFSAGALLNLPVELELSADDGQLIISDVVNQRVCAADLTTRTLRTLVGTGGACWRFGPANPAACANVGGGGLAGCPAVLTGAGGVPCASVGMPLGVGLSADGTRLFMAAHLQNSVATLAAPLAAAPGALQPFCTMDYDTDLHSPTLRETCEERACMLHRPFDVVSTVDGMLYVAVTNGITVINTQTLACRQVAGAYWQFQRSLSAGFADGGLGADMVEPDSRLNQPSRMAVDNARGILYIADSTEGALRRVLVDGKCRCAEGSLFVQSALACYNPTPAWDTGLMLLLCPPGQFALQADGAAECRPCAEADAMGVAAVACLPLLKGAGTADAWQSAQNGPGVGGGVSFAQVAARPEPLGAVVADWFYNGEPMAPQPAWDDGFRADSAVRYRLGQVPGHAPWGGEFLTLTFDPASRRWARETRTLLQPLRVLPGLWQSCTNVTITASGHQRVDVRCACSQVPGTNFADTTFGTGGGLVRWQELRLEAHSRQGRILGGGGAVLADFVRPITEDRPNIVQSDPRYSTLVKQLSRFMILGTDNARLSADVCAWSARGPCFPTIRHVAGTDAKSVLNLPLLPSQPLVYDAENGSWPMGTNVLCAAGWPAHYRCPSGYTWVGMNTSALADGQFVAGTSLLRGQIACLSCLPGAFSNTAEGRGAAYACTACDLGMFSTAVASTACEACPAGTYANTSGVSGCAACQPNHYTEEAATDVSMCSPCAPGTGNCTDCVPGQFQDQAAQGNCHPCHPGSFSNRSNQSVCELCPPGKYQPRGNQARCRVCAPGQYTPPDQGTGAWGGATACTDCAAADCPLVIGGVCGQGCGINYYWDEDTAQADIGAQDETALVALRLLMDSDTTASIMSRFCQRCLPGSISPHAVCATMSSACWGDWPGLYVAQQRSADGVGDTIAACPAGQGPNAELTGCAPCAAGLYSTIGSGCLPCAAGGYSTAAGSTACVRCAAGSFTPPLSSAQRCLSARYVVRGWCNAEGRTACTACSSGTFAAHTGAVGCVPCLAGSYAASPGAAACTLCPPGRYSSSNQSSSPCHAECFATQGMYSGAGASACVYCAGGLVEEASSACVGCGLGKYEKSLSSGARFCEECPAGLVQLRTAFSSSEADCVPCAPPSIRYAVYNTPRELRGRHCLWADPGFVSDRRGRADGGAVAQMPCLAGQFRGNASLECVPCPAGHWAAEGSAACTPCQRGTYRDDDPDMGQDGSECMPCPQGHVAGDTGTMRCTPCVPGQVTTDGSTRCAPCPLHTYSLQPSMPCTPCMDNLVSTPGATACASCPAWTTFISVQFAARAQMPSPSGGGACGVCPPGYYMQTSLVEGSEMSVVYTCRACPPGKHNALGGATSSKACIPCAVPAYIPNNPAGGASICVRCAPGTASTNGVRCAACRAGNFSSQGLVCARCPPGWYTNAEGASECQPCPGGTYNAAHGAVRCTSCPRGAFNNVTTGGVQACRVCEPDGFSSGVGAVQCTQRLATCQPGQHIVQRRDTPTEDNTCAFCAPCGSEEYTVSTLTETWSALTFSAMGAIPPDSCPGNTSVPGYRCIPNAWPAGQYITPATLQQTLTGYGPSGASTLMMSAFPCRDLTSFPSGVDPAAVVAASELMDYTVGPTFECYIGCKYALDENRALAYARAYPDGRGGLEAPALNIFYPSTAKLFARQLCAPCSTAPCSRLGRFRPVVASYANATTAAGGGRRQCGPPCRLHPKLCVESGDGVTFNDGCIGACAPPPAHAITTGGSAVTGSDQCPWVCQGQTSPFVPGYHLRDNGTGCEWCGNMLTCDATHVHVPPFMCHPYSRTADVCRPCLAMEGGRPAAWLLEDAGNATAGGRCTYECDWGYYSVDEARTGCRPCTFLNNATCPIGMFRDTAACYASGEAPACAPCVAPADLRTNAGVLRATYRSAGVPGVNDSCFALCNVGYHTVLRSSMLPLLAGPAAYVYVLDTGSAAENVSVGAIGCVLCAMSITLPCHGACSPNFYRDRSVLLDNSAGACRRCLTNAECGVGEFAPLCLGNGTTNVACQPCPRSRLLQAPPSNGARPMAVRVFVPYSALNSPAGQSGLIRSDVADGRACPTACAVNRMLDPNDRISCITCEDYTAGKGCAAEEERVMRTVPGGYAPQQPRACAFRNAHWNATQGPVWWMAPRFTPSYLGGLRGNPLTGMYLRAGVCWACPTGLGTTDASRDLCELLPGFGLVGQGMVIERAPIPTLGEDLAIVLDEPLPSVPPDLRQRLADGGASAYESLDRRRQRRRMLLALDGHDPAGSATLTGAVAVAVPVRHRALLQEEAPPEGGPSSSQAVAENFGECLIGTYNTGRGTRVCRTCPPWTTTYARGAVSLFQCVCLYGFYNESQTSGGGCTPCPADTYDRRIMWGPPLGHADSDDTEAGDLPTNETKAEACLECPHYETTFGGIAQSSCACRAGYVRQAVTAGTENTQNQSSLRGRVCVPCPAGFFCVPCFQGQPGCPNSLVWITQCMPNGISPPGSASLANCTCSSNQTRLLRGGPGATLEALLAPTLGRPTNAGMYCLDPPPHSEYDPVLLRLACKRGWTPHYHALQPQQLLGCSLCGRGRFAVSEPSLTAQLQCVPCPIGNYTDRTDAIGGCTPCGKGLTTLAQGSTSASNCTCSVGMGRDRETQECKGCTLFEYQSVDGKTCVRCPDPNMLTNGRALTVDECQCGPGFARSQLPMAEANGGSKPMCVPCAVGTFSAVASANTACARCSIGQTTRGVGARSKSACVCDAMQGFVQVSGGLCRNTSLLAVWK